MPHSRPIDNWVEFRTWATLTITEPLMRRKRLGGRWDSSAVGFEPGHGFPEDMGFGARIYDDVLAGRLNRRSSQSDRKVTGRLFDRVASGVDSNGVGEIHGHSITTEQRFGGTRAFPGGRESGNAQCGHPWGESRRLAARPVGLRPHRLPPGGGDADLGLGPIQAKTRTRRARRVLNEIPSTPRTGRAPVVRRGPKRSRCRSKRSLTNSRLPRMAPSVK